MISYRMLATSVNIPKSISLHLQNSNIATDISCCAYIKIQYAVCNLTYINLMCVGGNSSNNEKKSHINHSPEPHLPEGTSIVDTATRNKCLLRITAKMNYKLSAVA